MKMSKKEIRFKMVDLGEGEELCLEINGTIYDVLSFDTSNSEDTLQMILEEDLTAEEVIAIETALMYLEAHLTAVGNLPNEMDVTT